MKRLILIPHIAVVCFVFFSCGGDKPTGNGTPGFSASKLTIVASSLSNTRYLSYIGAPVTRIAVKGRVSNNTNIVLTNVQVFALGSGAGGLSDDGRDDASPTSVGPGATAEFAVNLIPGITTVKLTAHSDQGTGVSFTYSTP